MTWRRRTRTRVLRDLRRLPLPPHDDRDPSPTAGPLCFVAAIFTIVWLRWIADRAGRDQRARRSARKARRAAWPRDPRLRPPTPRCRRRCPHPREAPSDRSRCDARAGARTVSARRSFVRRGSRSASPGSTRSTDVDIDVLPRRAGRAHRARTARGRRRSSTACSACCAPREARSGSTAQDITGLPVYRRARLGIGRTFQRLELFSGTSVREHFLVADRARRGTGRLWKDVLNLSRPTPDELELARRA